MDINPNPRTPDFNVGSNPGAKCFVAKFFSFREPPSVIFSTLRSGDGGISRCINSLAMILYVFFYWQRILRQQYSGMTCFPGAHVFFALVALSVCTVQSKCRSPTSSTQ